jgi:putative ABC transport system ATP-binding protein
MFTVQDLDFRYGPGGFRLRVPQLAIAKGAKAALIGPSGSGKTTLLNLLAGVAWPQAGRVVANGVELSALSDTARRDFRVRQSGLVFQEFELLDHLTVLDNVLLAYRLSPKLTLDRRVRDRALALAGDVGLDGQLHRNVRRLSQGERQRVAVCRALLPEPPLLLCDEPTGNLDPANKQQVLDILIGCVEQRGATLVAVTHDREILPRFDTVIDFGQFPRPDEAAP